MRARSTERHHIMMLVDLGVVGEKPLQWLINPIQTVRAYVGGGGGGIKHPVSKETSLELGFDAIAPSFWLNSRENNSFEATANMVSCVFGLVDTIFWSWLRTHKPGVFCRHRSDDVSLQYITQLSFDGYGNNYNLREIGPRTCSR